MVTAHAAESSVLKAQPVRRAELMTKEGEDYKPSNQWQRVDSEQRRCEENWRGKT